MTAPTPAQWKDALTQCTPAACPANFQEQIKLLETPYQILLDKHQVPFRIQARMAELAITTTARMACTFSDPAQFMEKGPHIFEYNNAEEGTKASLSMRILMTFNECHMKHNGVAHSPTKEKNTQPTTDVGGWHREDLLRIWESKTGRTRPRKSEQGSDNLIKAMKDSLEKGEIPVILPKKIVSADPTRYISLGSKKRKTDSDDEYEGRLPTDSKSWRQYLTVHDNTLMMCLWNYSHIQKLQVDITDLEYFHEKFIDIWERGHTTMHTLILAERKAFQQIHDDIFRGRTFKEAMSFLLTDQFFWQHEVYSRQMTRNPTTPTLGRRDSEPNSPNKPKDKGNGKGKGKEACKKWNEGKCKWPHCKYLHRCNAILKNGKPCGGNHKAKDCTRNS